ncbi:class I SAM-dependent methyltransferase [Rhodophyticola sp. CCM32]|uniref:class I SAM-dependent methyltransferase n=1 Tax=Rhodophyticola sp. CCM32 TaxID=2916397 RepID=UPI00143D1D23|nr:methyltransferase domain-containing protein [Rhodophyticola sp. CCM32]
MDWLEIARPWLAHEREIELSHAPVLQALMARTNLREGSRVLDIGIGSGASLLAAAEAVGAEGHVLGLDIAPPLAARAAERAPAHAEVALGDAQTHAFAPAAVDTVISMFGVMFFADPVAAFRNIRSAVKPQGRLCFACWADRSANPWFSVSAEAAASVMGPGDTPDDPHASGPFAFADAARVLAILQAAGWQAEVSTRDLHLTPGCTAVALADLHTGIGPATRRLRQENADEATRNAVRAALVAGFAGFEEAGMVRVPARVHLFHAVNPG